MHNTMFGDNCIDYSKTKIFTFFTETLEEIIKFARKLPLVTVSSVMRLAMFFDLCRTCIVALNVYILCRSSPVYDYDLM